MKVLVFLFHLLLISCKNEANLIRVVHERPINKIVLEANNLPYYVTFNEKVRGNERILIEYVEKQINTNRDQLKKSYFTDLDGHELNRHHAFLVLYSNLLIKFGDETNIKFLINEVLTKKWDDGIDPYIAYNILKKLGLDTAYNLNNSTGPRTFLSKEEQLKFFEEIVDKKLSATP